MDILEKIDTMLNEGDTEVRELTLYITNDAQLYRQRIEPIIKNLKKKLAKGIYDKSKSIPMWKSLADQGAKKYDKEHSSPGAKTFSVADRKAVAQELADFYDDEVTYQD